MSSVRRLKTARKSIPESLVNHVVLSACCVCMVHAAHMYADDTAGTLEVFSLFDKDEDGVVKVIDIGPMLRSIGFNPSEADIERLQEEQDTDNGTCSIGRPATGYSSPSSSVAAKLVNGPWCKKNRWAPYSHREKNSLNR